MVVGTIVPEKATGLVAPDTTTPLDPTIDMAAHCRSGGLKMGVPRPSAAVSGHFYCLTLAHDNDADAFQETFARIAESIKLTDGR